MQEKRLTNLEYLMKLSVIAGIYVVVTYIFSFMSFGEIQFRVSEVLMLLCFFNKKYSPSLIIGCLITNIVSPYGIVDVIFGTFATMIACLILSLFKSKHLFIASLFVAVANIIVGIEISLVNSLTLNLAILTTLNIFISELIVVSFIGVPLFKVLMKNDKFKDLIINI